MVALASLSGAIPPKPDSVALAARHGTAYAVTGFLAGTASTCTSLSYNRLFLSPTSSLPRFSLEHARGVGRALAHGSLAAGIRFGGFALARIAIQESMPTGENRTLKVAQTGLAGGVGGALEGALLGVRCKRLETLSRQGSRVGLCFTVYAACMNYSSLHSSTPPFFPLSLAYGTIAGLVGVSCLHGIETGRTIAHGLRAGLIPRNALAVGVVISVQNWLVAKLLARTNTR